MSIPNTVLGPLKTGQKCGDCECVWHYWTKYNNNVLYFNYWINLNYINNVPTLEPIGVYDSFVVVYYNYMKPYREIF